MKAETADNESPANALTHLQKQCKPQDSRDSARPWSLHIDKPAAVKSSK